MDGLVSLELVRFGFSVTGLVWFLCNRFGLVSLKLVWFGFPGTGMVWFLWNRFGLVSLELVWFSRNWFGLVFPELVWFPRNWFGFPGTSLDWISIKTDLVWFGRSSSSRWINRAWTPQTLFSSSRSLWASDRKVFFLKLFSNIKELCLCHADSIFLISLFLGYKDIVIRKLEFVAETQFL